MAVQQPAHEPAYAYLHGFMSGPASTKGRAFQVSFAQRGIHLELLDINAGGSPAGMTISHGLAVLSAWRQKAREEERGRKLRLIGSSLGAYIAALFAEGEPDAIDRMFLMCPAFDLTTRWQSSLGKDGLDAWRSNGWRGFSSSVSGADGNTVRVPWSSAEDLMAYSSWPQYRCPAVLLHGLQDTTVPVTTTRTFLRRSPEVAARTLAVFVEDDHALVKPMTAALAAKLAAEFFGL
ncbi:unnamed protein product, partial [Phaeothamnion confervicola]